MEIIIILSVIIVILSFIIYFLIRNYRRLSKELMVKDIQKRSQASIYGKISEQFFPLMMDYPYDPQNFRFIGSPIDGIQFTDDKIIFCEFKLHKSNLSDHQKRIKELIKNKKVEWIEFRFKL
jgi:predicted Holliday junction resolvase-like endonuclease